MGLHPDFVVHLSSMERPSQNYHYPLRSLLVHGRGEPGVQSQGSVPVAEVYQAY